MAYPPDNNTPPALPVEGTKIVIPAEKKPSSPIVSSLRKADTNEDGRYSRAELREGVKALAGSIRDESCETSTAAIMAENAQDGMTSLLYDAEGKAYDKAQTTLSENLRDLYNQNHGQAVFQEAFPAGIDKAHASDFKDMAKALGDKIRECGLYAPQSPYPDAPDNGYAQNNPPPVTVTARDGSRER